MLPQGAEGLGELVGGTALPQRQDAAGVARRRWCSTSTRVVAVEVGDPRRGVAGLERPGVQRSAGLALGDEVLGQHEAVPVPGPALAEGQDVEHPVAVERVPPPVGPRELGVGSVAHVRPVELERDLAHHRQIAGVELVLDRLEEARADPPEAGSTRSVSIAGSIMLLCLLRPATPVDRPDRGLA